MAHTVTVRLIELAPMLVQTTPIGSCYRVGGLPARRDLSRFSTAADDALSEWAGDFMDDLIPGGDVEEGLRVLSPICIAYEVRTGSAIEGGCVDDMADGEAVQERCHLLARNVAFWAVPGSSGVAALGDACGPHLVDVVDEDVVISDVGERAGGSVRGEWGDEGRR